jgi:gluconolactonase
MALHKFDVIGEGLAFPEGPIACDDGSVIVGEIGAGQVTRIMPDGRKHLVAKTGGGPNGLAFGPDGALFCCNNGGFGELIEFNGLRVPFGQNPNYKSGSIQRINISTGKVEVVYDACDGRMLSSPNDIVFDRGGGFWFTDYGHVFEDRHMAGGLFYARTDGSLIRKICHGAHFNGVGLSPDGRTVYTGMTEQRWIMAFDADPNAQPIALYNARIIADFPRRCMPDSLAIEADGTIAQACVFEASCVARVDPATGVAQMLEFDDPITTNICFGGRDMKTAYVTLSGTGRLAKAAWPAPGLPLAFNG